MPVTRRMREFKTRNFIFYLLGISKLMCNDYETFEYYVKIHNKSYSPHTAYLLHEWHI